MKLVVVVLTFVVAAFAARAPEVGFGERTPIVDSPQSILKTAETEEEKQARLMARRAAIAEARARKGIGQTGVYFPDGGTKDTVKKGVVVTQPVIKIAGKQGPETVSTAEAKAIADVGKQEPHFNVAEEHPLSSLDLVESELSRNQKVQKEMSAELKKIEKLESSLPLAQRMRMQEHYDELMVDYLKLQNEERILNLEKVVNKKLAVFKKGSEQEKILVNCQEFLAFYKKQSSTVVFSEAELENIFILLKLPSLSDESLGKMSVGDLWVFEEGRKTTGVLQKAEEELKKFEPALPEEQQDVLKKYFEDREKKITAELLGKNPSDENVVFGEIDPLMKKNLISVRLADIRSRVNLLRLILEKPAKPTIDWGDYDQQVKDLSGLIEDSNEHFNAKGLTGEDEALYNTLELESKTVLVDLEKLAKARLMNSFESGTLQPGDFNKYVRTFVMKGSNLSDLVELKNFEKVKQNDLSLEQQEFVQKIVQQVETFTSLKTQAIDANDVVRMEELQDEMRDIYEDVYRNNWKEKDLTDLDFKVLTGMRNSINELLKQFGEKAQSFTSAATNKKSFADRVKYRFKRLFVRATIDPRKMRYSSEFARNSKLRLDLVDFKKAATNGYVTTVKSGIDGYKKNLETVNKSETAFSKKLTSDDKAKNAEALLDLSNTIKALEPQIESAKVVQQQLLALKGIADCDGTLTYKKAEQSLSIDIPGIADLPEEGVVPKGTENTVRARVFLERMKSTGQGHRSTFYKESARILLEKDGSVEAQAIIEALKNNKNLEPEQREFLSSLYVTWRGKIQEKLKTNPDRTDLLLVSLLQSKEANSAYLAMLRSPVTGGYVLDAYINKRDVTVPSAQAKTIAKQLQGAGDLDSFVTDAGRTVSRLQKLEPPVVPAA